MPEIPRNNELGHAPREEYAAYPRGPLGGMYGSSNHLLALWEGYSGLNYVAILNVALFAVGELVTLTPIWSDSSPESVLVFFGAYFFVLFIVIVACTLPYNRKIGYGLGWAPAGPVTAAILMGLNSALCCGVVGYIIMQMLAVAEMKRYGLRMGLLGMRKKEVLTVVEAIRAHEVRLTQSGMRG